MNQAGDHRTLLDGRIEIFDGEKWFVGGSATDWEAVAADQAMTIIMLKTDIDILLEAMTLAKIQGSRKDCNRILEEALDKYRVQK